MAVSRAAALLSLVRPRQLRAREYLAVTEEVRQVTAIEPVEPYELERESLAAHLESLGGAGVRAAQLLLRTERPRPSEAVEPDVGPKGTARGYRPIMHELRPSSASERDAVEAAQSEAAAEVFPRDAASGRRTPTRAAATRLIASSLLDEDPLVQVAAAAAALRVDEINPLAEAILYESDREGSDEIAELSRTILVTDRSSETRRIEIEHPTGARDPVADSAIVHGTWARWGRWWRPDGSLHRYLRDEAGVFPHLYQGGQPFEWSGYFSFRAWAKPKKDWHRQQAADSLAWWAERKLVPAPDLIGHSYGGSLSMLATQAEKKLRGGVLLSPAVHKTCLPNSNNYEQILHVTTKLDLVLLADLSTPRLLSVLPNVTTWQVRRKGLTGHGATHDPGIWRESGLTEYLRATWLPALSAR